jgi:drug/metabolite transporter (DMT)-like permease
MPTNPILAGLLISALAHAVYTAFDTVSKIVIADYPVFQVLAVECSVAALVSLAYFAIAHGKQFWGDLVMKDWKLFAGASIFRLVGQFLVFFAVTHITLAAFYVALFIVPLVVALMSAFLLKEKIDKPLTFTLMASFIGILIALRPGEDTNWWILVVLAGSVCIAAYVVILRKAAATESANALSFYIIAISALVFMVPAALVFKLPTVSDFLLMVVGGVLYGVANILYVAAIRLAPASYVSSAQFLQLIYGSIAGYVVFNEVPVIWTYVGGILVIAANLYLIRMQGRRFKPA